MISGHDCLPPPAPIPPEESSAPGESPTQKTSAGQMAINAVLFFGTTAWILYTVRPAMRVPLIVVFGIETVLLVIYQIIHVVMGLAFKIRPEEVAIGFGPPLLRIRVRSVEVRVNCIPLAGHTKFPAKGPGSGDFSDLPRSAQLMIHWSASIGMLVLGAFLLGPIEAAVTLGHAYERGIPGSFHLTRIATPFVRDFMEQISAGCGIDTVGVMAVAFAAINFPPAVGRTLILPDEDRSWIARLARYFVSLLVHLACAYCGLAWLLAFVLVLLKPHVHPQ